MACLLGRKKTIYLLLYLKGTIKSMVLTSGCSPFHVFAVEFWVVNGLEWVLVLEWAFPCWISFYSRFRSIQKHEEASSTFLNLECSLMSFHNREPRGHPTCIFQWLTSLFPSLSLPLSSRLMHIVIEKAPCGIFHCHCLKLSRLYVSLSLSLARAYKLCLRVRVQGILCNFVHINCITLFAFFRKLFFIGILEINYTQQQQQQQPHQNKNSECSIGRNGFCELWWCKNEQKIC